MSGSFGKGIPVGVLGAAGSSVGVLAGVIEGVVEGVAVGGTSSAAVGVTVNCGLAVSKALTPSSPTTAVAKTSNTAASVSVGVGGLVELAVGTTWVGGAAIAVAAAVFCRSRLPGWSADSAVGANVGSGGSGLNREQPDKIRLNNTRHEAKYRQRTIALHYNNPLLINTNRPAGIRKF
jgi:hypothetical protein